MKKSGLQTLTRLALPAIAGLAVLLAGQSARAAGSTFASFSDDANQFSFLPTDSTSATLSATNAAVSFTFNPTLVPGAPVGPQMATLNFSISTTMAASNVGGTDIQNFNGSNGMMVTGGSFSFIDTTGLDAGKNLLSGSFTTASGSGGDGSGLFSLGSSGSTAGNTVSFMSDFLKFSPAAINGMSLAFNSLTNGGPSLGATFLNMFTASATGNFSSVASPSVSSTPEPASVAMLGLGLAGVGAFSAARRRVKKPA